MQRVVNVSESTLIEKQEDRSTIEEKPVRWPDEESMS